MDSSQTTQEHRRLNLIVAVTGASGSLYAGHFIRALDDYVPGSSALIISPAALRVYQTELGGTANSAAELLAEILAGENGANHSFAIEDYHNIGARSASGSAAYDGMVIVPCSMNTLAAIAHGLSGNLIERAADVCLKERRPLIVVPRETPYSLIHLRNMTALTEAGGTVLPASPGFYHRPTQIDELGHFVAGRILAQFGVRPTQFPTWSG